MTSHTDLARRVATRVEVGGDVVADRSATALCAAILHLANAIDAMPGGPNHVADAPPAAGADAGFDRTRDYRDRDGDLWRYDTSARRWRHISTGPDGKPYWSRNMSDTPPAAYGPYTTGETNTTVNKAPGGNTATEHTIDAVRGALRDTGLSIVADMIGDRFTQAFAKQLKARDTYMIRIPDTAGGGHVA